MQLGEPADLGLSPRLVGEVGEGRAAPERESLAQAPARSRRLGSARLGDEPLEAVQVETVRLDDELVARRARDDHVAAERLAELGDVRLQDLRRRGRRAAGPEILDQPVARDGLTRVQEQDREQRTRLRRVQRDDAAVGDGFERPEYAEVHGGSAPNVAPSPPPCALERRCTGTAPALYLPWGGGAESRVEHTSSQPRAGGIEMTASAPRTTAGPAVGPATPTLDEEAARFTRRPDR